MGLDEVEKEYMNKIQSASTVDLAVYYTEGIARYRKFVKQVNSSHPTRHELS